MESTEYRNHEMDEKMSNNVCDDDILKYGAEDSEEECLTLMDLPDEVLVNIMEYLNLRDLYNLTLTCSQFHSLFDHPRLWRVANIVLMIVAKEPGKNSFRWRMVAMMHQTMANIVQRFGHLFQHLSLELQGYVQPFDESCKTLLQLLNKECRLESLSIKLGVLTSTDKIISQHSKRFTNLTDLPLLVGLVKSAVRLKRLTLVSWPLHEQTFDDKDIYAAIMNNCKNEGIESLNMFVPKLKRNHWTDRIPKLPSQALTLNLIAPLKNLTHLALRSPMLSNDLLNTLACPRRKPLISLQVLIMYSQDSVLMEGFKIPEISANAWSNLRRSSPELSVEFVIFSRVPQQALTALLQPEVQLSSLKILEFGRCDSELIGVLAENYHRTLSQFISYCDCRPCDEELLKLVKTCTLTHLVYHGDIHYKTVENIATIIRETQMDLTCLELKKSNIKTDDPFGEVDEDVVIAKDDSSDEYYLTAVRAWNEDEIQRNKRLDNMCLHVSSCLGYKWFPEEK